MNLTELVRALDEAGVRLSLRLVVDAPAGALDGRLRGGIAEHRARLIERLGREASWTELERGRWGPALDAAAAPPRPPPRVGPREPGDDDHEPNPAERLREFNRRIGRPDPPELDRET